MAYDPVLVDRIRELVLGTPGLEEKAMFGGLAFLVGGNMTVSASRSGGLLVHVDPVRGEQLLAKPHAAPMEMRGRVMSGWVLVAPEGLKGKALATWVREGIAYGQSLPAKAPNAKRNMSTKGRT